MNIKKIIAAALVWALILTLSPIASGAYRDPDTGAELRMGFNPVVKQEDGVLEYSLYAYRLDGMTNCDIEVTFGEGLTYLSYEESSGADYFFCEENNGRIFISAIYTGKNENDNFKLFTLKFSFAVGSEYPETVLTNLAGTYIKTVHPVQTVSSQPAEPTTLAPATTTLPPVTTTEKVDGGFPRGDVDGNGSIEAADARLALRSSAHLETLSPSAFSAADVDSDNKVTARDARAILRFTAGLQSFS